MLLLFLLKFFFSVHGNINCCTYTTIAACCFCLVFRNQKIKKLTPFPRGRGRWTHHHLRGTRIGRKYNIASDDDYIFFIIIQWRPTIMMVIIIIVSLVCRVRAVHERITRVSSCVCEIARTQKLFCWISRVRMIIIFAFYKSRNCPTIIHDLKPI